MLVGRRGMREDGERGVRGEMWERECVAMSGIISFCSQDFEVQEDTE